MSPFKRRNFLKLASATLAGIGLTHLDIQRQGLRYARSLAQPTKRKRALLIGINQYGESKRFTNLKGCLTDVALQKELLKHRFGFAESDILTLTDETKDKPTRDNILTAFEEFLIKPCREEDVIVFHFSGHGDRVLDPTPIRNAKGKLEYFNSTFVPSKPQYNLEQKIVGDITGKTLFLLASALKSENVTLVLDSCHSGGGTRGNVRIRSRSSGGGFELQPNSTELAFQEKWQQELKLTTEELTRRREKSNAKGVVIAAAQASEEALDVSWNGLAADARFSGFDAGVFTYFLTQYLWQQEVSFETAIAQVTRSLKQENFAQKPKLETQAERDFQQEPLYFVQPKNVNAPPAEAAILQVNGDRGKAWLGGITPGNLQAFGRGALLSTFDRGTDTEVELLARNGLTADIKLSGSAKAGNLLQEKARVIPSDFTLNIGLDPSLGSETAQAQQLLSNIPHLTSINFQGGNVPYPGEIHYIFTRFTEQYRQSFAQQGIKSLPTVDSFGLISQSFDEIIPDSFGKANESLSEAINQRLNPKIKALIAARLIKLSLNAQSTRLNVEAILQREDHSAQLIGQAFTVRGRRTSHLTQPEQSGVLSRNQPFQFKVINQEKTALYFSILAIDSTGEITVLFPNQYGTEENKTLIAANETRFIPDPSIDDFQFQAESAGVGEMLIIFSRSPLRKAMLALQSLAVEQYQPQRGAFVSPNLDAIADLLGDLGNSTRGGSGSRHSESKSNPQLSVSDIAALSISFTVL